MRRFEWVLVFATVVAVAWPVVFGIRPRRGIVAGVVLGALFVQLQFEGYRWQMIPVYLLTVGLAVGDVLFVDRELRWTNRISRGIFGLLAVALVALLPLALPVPRIPIPTGGLSVGTVSFEVVAPDREMVFGVESEGSRPLMVQVWYPAQRVPGQSPVLWSEDWDLVAPAASRRMGLPGWFLNHTKFTSAHARSMAPIAPGTYPVVIYSHGWTGFRTVAVNQMESLASNGYIVVAIDHTQAAVVTRFPDGTVVNYNPEVLPSVTTIGETAYAAAAEALVETLADDIVSVIDAIELGADGPFAYIAANADLARIGVFGHSAGGGAAVRVCLLDQRCRAVVGFDPWVEPLSMRVLRTTATRPALFMRSEGWRGTPNDTVLRGIAGRGESTTYWLGVEGAGHNDFVMVPLLSPVSSQLGFRGSIRAGRILPIIDNYLVGFFDVFLLGTGSAALDTVRFPEVMLDVIAP